MKHNVKITLILLSMFLITQFIGLYVISSDPFHITTNVGNETIIEENPTLSWIQPPEVEQESDFGAYFGSLIFAFIFAILLFFLLTKFKIDSILRGWFFVVIILSLFITFNAFFPKTVFFAIIAAILAVSLAFIKIFKRNLIIHNLTELLIYPGIAVIFVPILNFWTMILLLVLISAYDIWAVWHSGIMQKMAMFKGGVIVIPTLIISQIKSSITVEVEIICDKKIVANPRGNVGAIQVYTTASYEFKTYTPHQRDLDRALQSALLEIPLDKIRAGQVPDQWSNRVIACALGKPDGAISLEDPTEVKLALDQGSQQGAITPWTRRFFHAWLADQKDRLSAAPVSSFAT